jgi:hypothetical protein
VASHGVRVLPVTLSTFGRRLLSNSHGALSATAVSTLGAAADDTVTATVKLTG